MAPLADMPGSETKSVLSAILLADSFAQSFAPITLEKPKMLLPLVNMPMIDYTLEWLAASGVEEVFVVCCAHSEQVKAHLASPKWSQQKAMKLHIVISTSCLSAGEALRLMDQKDLIKSDFVLMGGDVISNLDLKSIISAHKKRRAEDRHAIMTMVMQSSRNVKHKCWAGESEILVALDPLSSRLLRLEDLDSSKQKKHLTLDAQNFSERDMISLRTDLLDTRIYICTPDVLMLFSDNFDYQNIEHDFISGVLSEEELGNTMHVHEVESGFACQVRNLRSYDAISRAVLQRWSFPFLVDSGSLHGADPTSTYSFKRHNSYREQHVKVARTAVVGRDSAVGNRSSLDEGTQVTCSVIGRNCHIGRGVRMDGCYIQDNVRVGDGAHLTSAMVCEGAVIMHDAVVQPGSVISFQAVIGAGHQVPAHTRISLCQSQNNQSSMVDEDVEYSAAGQIAASPNSASPISSQQRGQRGGVPGPKGIAKEAAKALAQGKAPEVAVEFDEEVVGTGGAGFAWPSPLDLQEQRLHSISLPPNPPQYTWDSDSDEGSIADVQQDHMEPVVQDTEALFKKEVSETFLRCVKMGYDQDLAVIELNGLKIAEDRTFADCARHVFASILDLCLPPPALCKSEYHNLYQSTVPDIQSQAGRGELLQRLSSKLKEWAPLLQRFLKSQDEQVELLLTLEEYCEEERDHTAHGHCFEAVFQQVVKLLYDDDIIEEDAVLVWADEKQMAEEDERKYLKKAAAFIAWLREAESEEETSSVDSD